MELNQQERVDKMMRAKKRVDNLKGFYIHVLVYIIVNLAIISLTVFARMSSGENFVEAFFNFGTFSTPFFWGIGLGFHGIRALGRNPFFSKDWEQRQIEKYMRDDDRKERY